MDKLLEKTDLQLYTKIKKSLVGKETMIAVSKKIGFSYPGLKSALESGSIRLVDFLNLCITIKRNPSEFIDLFGAVDSRPDESLKAKDYVIETQKKLIERMEKEIHELRNRAKSI